MALNDFLDELDKLADQAISQLSNVADDDTLEACRVKYRGAKQGLLKGIQKGLAKTYEDVHIAWTDQATTKKFPFGFWGANGGFPRENAEEVRAEVDRSCEICRSATQKNK